MESSAARQANRSAVLWAVLRAGTASRIDIARSAGLSAATVSRVIDGLIADGLVREAAAVPTGRPGRRITPVCFVAEAGVVVGVDLGGSNCRLIAVDLLGTVRARVRTTTPAGHSTGQLARWVADSIGELVGEAPLAFVSVGLPGVVNTAAGEVRAAPNLPQVEGGAFIAALTDLMDAPVAFDNDSNLALRGEMRLGAARDCRSAVMFTIGTGLGAGVVLDNRLLRGRTGLVGEFGALPVADGTLEDVLAGRGLLEASAAAGFALDSPAPVFAEGAPPALVAVRRRFAEALLLGLVAVAAAYEPEVIVIGGGVAPSLGAVVAEASRALAARLPGAPRVELSSLGDPAGAIGAVIAGLHDAYVGLGVDEALLDGSIGPGLAELEGMPEGRFADVS